MKNDKEVFDDIHKTLHTFRDMKLVIKAKLKNVYKNFEHKKVISEIGSTHTDINKIMIVLEKEMDNLIDICIDADDAEFKHDTMMDNYYSMAGYLCGYLLGIMNINKLVVCPDETIFKIAEKLHKYLFEDDGMMDKLLTEITN